jgi:hypothetical protein
MNFRALFLLTIFLSQFLFTATVMASPKYDVNNPVERYCGAIEAIATVVGKARDKNMQQDKLLKQIVHIDFISNDAQLQSDTREIINFMYVIAPNESSERLVSFVADKWCTKQLKK